jgi:phage-related protein
MKGFTMSLFDKAKEVISDNVDKIEGAIDKAGDLIDEKTAGKFSETIDKVQGAAQSAVDKVADAAGNAKEAASGAVETVADKVSGAAETVADKVDPK